MALWIFGYGSLIWKAGFEYDDRVEGYIKDMERVFYQGSTDHRGTPHYPGRTVTLEPRVGAITWGAAYKIENEDRKKAALEYLEVREKQYDVRLTKEFYTKASGDYAFATVLIYIGTSDNLKNPNYLGKAPLIEIAKQIATAEGPSGKNCDYLFNLEKALEKMGIIDKDIIHLSRLVREFISIS